MKASFRSTRSRSNGFTVMECIVAVSLLAIFSGTLFPMIARIQGVKAEQARRQAALIELRNLIELTATDANQPPELSPDFKKRHPGMELKTELLAREMTPAGEWRSYSLHWKNESGQPARPVELRFWRPAEEGTQQQDAATASAPTESAVNTVAEGT